ncbi:uncharacterized protein BKA55DRAFT_576452 [Fusarium redolens]|uniref:Secreted protein n=1 Tax=Fusarium redolens TaxID=48865 RepID=A0A9P9GN84_FUSRE|nr:uncharacterized protein BKA55DRAFT_576452 [Fusarium redolens]KAH7241074.1 hypothetical protein BKA55DRAFT_576452 [Fusarium redolens]
MASWVHGTISVSLAFLSVTWTADIDLERFMSSARSFFAESWSVLFKQLRLYGCVDDCLVAVGRLQYYTTVTQ